jgi:hypothetical protein
MAGQKGEQIAEHAKMRRAEKGEDGRGEGTAKDNSEDRKEREGNGREHIL